MPFCLHLPPFTCRVAPKARRHEVSRSVVHGGDTPPGEKVSAFRFRLCGGRSATRTANASFRTQPCEFTRVPACKYLFFWLHASAELLHAALECLSTLTSFACGVDFCHLASIICLPCSRRIPARELENCPVSMSMSKKARTSTPADDEEQALWRKQFAFRRGGSCAAVLLLRLAAPLTSAGWLMVDAASSTVVALLQLLVVDVVGVCNLL